MKTLCFSQLPPTDWENILLVFAILRELVRLDEQGQVRRSMGTNICDSLGAQRPGTRKVANYDPAIIRDYYARIACRATGGRFPNTSNYRE